MYRRQFLAGLSTATTAVAGGCLYEGSYIAELSLEPTSFGKQAQAVTTDGATLPPEKSTDIQRSARKNVPITVDTEIERWVRFDDGFYRVEPIERVVDIGGQAYAVDERTGSVSVIVVEQTSSAENVTPLSSLDPELQTTVRSLAAENETSVRPVSRTRADRTQLPAVPLNVATDGTVYRVEITEKTTEPRLDRARATRVATSASGFEQHLREEFLDGQVGRLQPVAFTALQRAIIQNAIEDTYTETADTRTEISDAYRTVTDKLDRAATTFVRERLVRYDGTLYTADWGIGIQEW